MSFDAGPGTEHILHGTGVTSGLVHGIAHRVQRASSVACDCVISADEIDSELLRLQHAIAASKEQLCAIQTEVESTLGSDSSSLFDSYLMMLDDPLLLQRIEDTLRQDLVCAEAACQRASVSLSRELSDIADDYLSERAKDILELGERIVRNLLGVEVDLDLSNLPSSCILVVDDLAPSETARLDSERVLGFVTSGGSRTSHTAILSRALGIPAVVAVQESLDVVVSGSDMILDGDSGEIRVNPSAKSRREFDLKRIAVQALQEQLQADSDRPVETLDGYQACLVANVELPSEALSVRQRYNVGIGLFRTEFLFVNGMNLLDEEEQFKAYRDTVEAVKPHSVIFRTLDIGGDKFLNQLPMPRELNPFMGMRAIRFSLSRPDIFKVQLRAILRASAYGKVRVMFPMISTYDELENVLRILDEVKGELKRDRIPFNENLDIGCMIEVPSAALLAERLVRHLTFFSIGTNDLVQYSLAVDRSNPTISHLYQPAHPSIIRMMKDVVDVANANGRWVSVCGEMAGDCLYTPLILGLGIHELSMSPVALGVIRKVIRSIKMHEAEHLVSYAMSCDRYSDVVAACQSLLDRACPDLKV